MYSLTLEWEKCPDGVELFDYGPERKAKIIAMGTGPSGKTFRCRSLRRFPIRLDISTLENPIVVRFVNARDDDARSQFFARFGFLYENDDEYPRRDVLEDQRNLRKFLELAGSGQTDKAATAINRRLASSKGLGLIAALDGNRLSLRLHSLHALMLMELAMIIEKDARLTSCGHCKVVFLTGPTTGRRSHARYCSDRCRVAAMRARKNQTT